MKKVILLNKQSKKARKEYYARQRCTWGELNPVTRSVPSGKTYNRNKIKQEIRRTGWKSESGFGADPSFFICPDVYCIRFQENVGALPVS